MTNLTKWKEYDSQLKAWNEEKQRQSVEFTITEDDPDADLRLPDIEVRFEKIALKAYKKYKIDNGKN